MSEQFLVLCHASSDTAAGETDKARRRWSTRSQSPCSQTHLHDPLFLLSS